MYRLCVGTLLTLLCQAKAKGTFNYDIVFAVSDVFDLKITDKTQANHIKRGHDGLSWEVINEVRTDKVSELAINFSTVLKKIDRKKREALVRAVKSIIMDDDQIAPDAPIGCDGFTKEEIRENHIFNEGQLWVSLFLYAIPNAHNTKYRAAIEAIDRDFVDRFIEGEEQIFFFDESLDNNGFKLKKIDAFRETFSVISSEPNKTWFTYVQYERSRLKYDQLKDYIANYLPEYIFSHQKNNDIGNERTALRQALKEFEAATISCKLHNKLQKDKLLGEMLLYNMLEQVLKAPKLMSRFEICSSSGQETVRSDGIYVYQKKVGQDVKYQLVYGVSDISDNIKTAFSNVCTRILEIEHKRKNEYNLIPRSAIKEFQKCFGNNDELRKILIPQENKTPSDRGYGIFAGYTINVVCHENIGGDKRPSLRVQLNTEPNTVTMALNRVLASECTLPKCDYYSFIMPFNKAEEDKIRIIEESVWDPKNEK